MTEVADLILRSGRAGVELALFILLPVMVVMLTLMRLLEARGILDRLVDAISPLLVPLGIPGLGVFALLQTILVSFAAPLATLAMMDRGGTSRRHIAATLALVLGLAQANVVFPMTALGLQGLKVMLVSVAAALIGAACTYHFFGHDLPDHDEQPEPRPGHPKASDAKGVLNVINRAGKEAFDISIGAIPMLILALLLVNALRGAGAIEAMEGLLAPLFVWIDMPSAMLLPVVTKYIAGGTAMMGVAADFLREGLVSTEAVNRVSGFLIHPFDIAGVAIFVSAGPRVASVLKPAALGAMVAILLRTLVHYFWV